MQFEKRQIGSILTILPFSAGCRSELLQWVLVLAGPADTYMFQGDFASMDPIARHPTVGRENERISSDPSPKVCSLRQGSKEITTGKGFTLSVPPQGQIQHSHPHPLPSTHAKSLKELTTSLDHEVAFLAQAPPCSSE